MISRALIPAAGRGVRAHPETRHTPKVLLPIDGKPIIQWNIELLRDALGIRDVTVIVGHGGDQVRRYLSNGEPFGVVVRYIDCPDPDVGLARGVLLAEGTFQEPFVTILGDELYLHSNHSELLNFRQVDFDAVCGVMHTLELHQIRRNYGVRVEESHITALVEKPHVIENDLLGCGTYLFGPAIFDAIRSTPPSPVSGKVELTDAIDSMARRSGRVVPFYLTGTYFNINTVDAWNYAQYKIRSGRFPGYKVSVVIPAFNEEASIASVVRDFRDCAHEVLVIDNSSTDATAVTARDAGARVQTVRLQGYGDTIRFGLDQAVGEILVVVEGDFSFRARDLGKMLEYLKDADMVIGTRTTRQLVEQGTNMRGLVRWGNVLVAKIVEALWWGQEPRFTDVGCTYRALWKDAYAAIKPLLGAVGPELSVEMMIAALQVRKRVIEIPVSYHTRIGGESKHSAGYWQLSRTALRMLATNFRKRFAGTLSVTPDRDGEDTERR